MQVPSAPEPLRAAAMLRCSDRSTVGPEERLNQILVLRRITQQVH
ncbi:hypothetical protein [Glutamicibacter sp.]|nr:hypothetical protein [Glutamicibacter sp.]